MRRALAALAIGINGLPLPLLAVGTSALAVVFALVPSPLYGDSHTEAAALWLHVPAMALGLATVVRFVDLWPPIGRDREGSAVVERVARGPLDGCGMILLAAAILLGSALALTGMGFAWLQQARGQPLPPARHTVDLAFQPAATAPGRPPAVATVGGGGANLRTSEVRLRFVFFAGESATAPPGALDTGLRLSGRSAADEPWAPLHEGVVNVNLFRDTAHLAFDDVELNAVQLEAVRGAPIAVRLGGAVALGAVPRSAIVNAGLAAFTYLGPTLLGCALIVLLRRQLSAGVCKALGVGTALGISLTGLGGTHTAIADLGAGRLIASFTARDLLQSEPVAGLGLMGCLAVAALALSAAGRLHRRRRSTMAMPAALPGLRATDD